MHIKRFIAALVAALMGVAMLTASPAQASDTQPVVSTDAEARALWKDLALRQLQEVTDAIVAGDDLGLEVITQSFQASLIALKYEDSGGWFHSSAQSALNEVITRFKETSNVRGNAGYNMGQTADAMGDGSTNSADTIYTVTMTDHVGPVLLEAAKAGAVDPSEMTFLLNAIMDIPVNDFPFGKCAQYSDAPVDAPYCVFNVTASVAGFLTDAMNAGFTVPGQATRIAELTPALAATYEAGGAVNGWPYGYGSSTAPRFTNQYWGSLGIANEDMNHAALTFASARKAGLVLQADEGTTHWLRYPRYPEYDTSKPIEDYHKKPREIMGRVRMSHAMPTTFPNNLLREALWYETVDLPKPASEMAQLGMWAKSLYENASKESTRPHTISSITKPEIYVGGVLKTGSPVLVDPGKTISIRSVIKNSDGIGIVYKTMGVKLQSAADGTFLSTNRSGHVGNIAFAYTMPTTSGTQRCFQVQHVGEATSTATCVKTR